MSNSLLSNYLSTRWRITLAVAVILLLVAASWPNSSSSIHSVDSGPSSTYTYSLTGKISNALPKWFSGSSHMGKPGEWTAEAQDEETSHHTSPPHTQQGSGSNKPPKIWPGSTPDTNEDVAICLVAKNQPEDLKEWFRHHYHHLGIRRFYVMDDRSAPPLSSEPDYTIPSSHITFVYWPPETHYPSSRQWFLYNECQSRFGHLHKWLGYIDADEFLETKDHPGKSIAEFLAEYEDDNYTADAAAQHPNVSSVGAFAINWQVHNSNGHLFRQPNTRQAYTSCIWDGPDPNGEDSHNQHVKSFVRTAYFDSLATVHNFNLNSSKVTVGEYGDVVTSHLHVPVTRDRIVLHHYTIKSKEDFEEKLHRGDVQDNPRSWWWWDKYEQSLRADCPGLAKYYP